MGSTPAEEKRQRDRESHTEFAQETTGKENMQACNHRFGSRPLSSQPGKNQSSNTSREQHGLSFCESRALNCSMRRSRKSWQTCIGKRSAGSRRYPRQCWRLSLILEAYTGVSDDEVIEATIMDCVDAEQAPYLHILARSQQLSAELREAA